MTKKELEARVAELEKEVQMANKHNDGYAGICKGYSELKAEIEKLKEAKKESVEEVKPEPKFKVGDRVKAIKPKDDNTLIVGKIGTIKALHSDVDHRYKVEFDEHINGHCCGGNAKSGHGWNCDEDTLELVKPEPKFKVGDRVRCVRSVDRNINVVDKIGTVVHIIPYEGSFKYGIGFDEEIVAGHSCDERCEVNHGWYCYETALEPAFKVGDRVEVDGDKGTIVGFDKDNWPGVAFDNPNVGRHDCGGLCKWGSGLWCIPRTVKPLKEEPKFKVGDRVKCIGIWCGNRCIVGKVGTVMSVSKSGVHYGIAFDDYVRGHSLGVNNDDVEYGHGWYCDESVLVLDEKAELRERVLKSLKFCTDRGGRNDCTVCPYYDPEHLDCVNTIMLDAIKLLED